MGELSFVEDVKQLAYGEGEILRGEGILAITKALLQSGVSYVGGYPGAPVSYLIDVLADANEPVLRPLGVYFEQSGSEAAAAALLGASINYPVRGAVTWKSVVGTNVASDALSHVASAGVIGGSLMFAFLSSLIDPSARIAAAIISGIGFLGAGVIIKGEHGTITNLTTAASVWFGCSIGIAIGYGLYFMALIGIIFAAAVPRIPSVSKEHSPFRKNGKGKKSAL